MIVVHHLNDSRSQRILWLLEELGIPYEIKYYERDPQTRLAPIELRAVHPLGKSPVITDDGRVVAESGAIIEHILYRHGNGRLRPNPGTADFDNYLQWLHFAEGSAMLPLILRANVTPLGDAAAAIMPRIENEIALNLQYIDATLRGKDFLLGDELSAADIQNSFVGELASARIGLAPYPGIAAWLQRFQSRPAYKAALARGGPYSFA